MARLENQKESKNFEDRVTSYVPQQITLSGGENDLLKGGMSLRDILLIRMLKGRRLTPYFNDWMEGGPSFPPADMLDEGPAASSTPSKTMMKAQDDWLMGNRPTMDFDPRPYNKKAKK